MSKSHQRSTQKEMFNTITQKYLDNVLNRSDGISELEVKFGTRGIKNITKDDFDNVIKKLISSGFKIVKSQEYCLKIQTEFTDISTGKTKLSNIRAEIYGLSNIQKYCRTDNLTDITYRFVQKTAASEGSEYIRPVNFDEFNFRVSYQKEKLIPPTSSLGQSILSTWVDNKKIFRHLNRTTLVHDNYPFFVDMSLVKESHRKDGHLRPEYSFQASQVYACEPKYEIEIEMDNSKVGAGTRLQSGVVVADMLRVGIQNILAGIQGTNFPVSYEELMHIKNDYYYLLHPGEKREARSKSKGEKSSATGESAEALMHQPIELNPNHFLGPSSYTLQVANIAPLNSECTIPNIRMDYTVTDKADGMRKMLYIAPNGRIYLINTNMDFEFTGAYAGEEKLYSTLIDGEHIIHNKRGEYINLFAAFDIYFLSNRDVRHHPFVNQLLEQEEAARVRDELLEDEGTLEADLEERKRESSSARRRREENQQEEDVRRGARKGNSESRLDLLKQVLQFMKIQPIIQGDNLPIKVNIKKFEIATPDKNIFMCSRTIMAGKDAGIYEYEIDGLIYTPANTGVASNVAGRAGPLHKVTWDMSFKWKPLNQNTIDFLLTTKKNQNGIETIGNIFESGIDTLKSEQLQQYKTIILRVGYDERKHGYLEPCAAVIDDKLPVPGNSDTSEGYKPIPFYPTNPYDPDTHICNIPLREDENGVLQMFTRQDEIFTDETIVEFSYDASRPKHWRWIPERVRYDKTSEYKRGVKNYGNAYHVANNNWYSIHNPITEEMIKTGENIPDELADDDIYYNRSSGDSKTRAMRDFHNLYVKKMLITKTASKGNTLIDYAVGKAGDFPKWIEAKLAFVFGIDLSKDNIENRLDGACARFLNYRKKFRSMPYALFVNGNSSMNIKSGDAMFTEKGKQIIHALFNEGPKDESLLGKGVYRQYGKALEGFNISSCQFALHYFFENIEKINNFIKNISQCTKVDGYFIGSCYDGVTMFKALRSIERGGSITLNIDDVKIWEVTKEYSQTSFDNDLSCVGYAIDVFQDSINKKIKEYLVNFAYFTQLMEAYGFELLKREDAIKLGIPNGTGMFSELFTKMESDIEQDKTQKTRYGFAPSMNTKEKQISFYNRYFIFKKISNVDVEDVFQSVTGIQSFQERANMKETLAAQMVASELLGEKGKKSSSLKYRPSKEAELKTLESETDVLLSSLSTGSDSSVVSKLFGSKSPRKSKKQSTPSGAVAMGKDVSDKGIVDLGKKAPLLVKKADVLQPALESNAAESILKKSKLGKKESKAKVDKIVLSGLDTIDSALLPDLPEVSSSIMESALAPPPPPPSQKLKLSLKKSASGTPDQAPK